MKKILIIILLPVICVWTSCKKDHDGPDDQSMPAVTDLQAIYDTASEAVKVSWDNPEGESLSRVELSYSPKDLAAGASKDLQLIDINGKKETSLLLNLVTPQKYTINAVAIGPKGTRSMIKSTEITILNYPTPLFLKYADTLMASVVQLFLDGKSRDIWTNSYPKGGGYWDGAAVVWGQGAAFSGYAALKEAAEAYPSYKSKYDGLYDSRLLTSLDKFITTKGTKAANTEKAYAVYPQNGNDRYYDDNIWIGTDMADLYMLTHDAKYLDRSRFVWNFILSGSDDMFGGGVHWKENSSSKNTCSNMPAVVLAAKLYQATQEQPYLDSAVKIYNWCKGVLMDPADHLYWDNVVSDGHGGINVSKSKFTYNTGQAVEAAALLYNITKDNAYLIDAENTASSIFKKWGKSFHSDALDKTFTAIDPSGNVWFRSVMLRGLIELYKIDKDRTYIDSYEDLLKHAWLSDCRNKNTNLLNDDFRGGTTQTSWKILFQGACIEMLARLSKLQSEGL